MKKYRTLVVLLCAGAFAFTSCNDSFLDEENYSYYSPEALADSLGFEASVIGLHNHLSTFYSKDNRQGWVSVWQVGTDIVWPTQPQGIETPYFNYSNLIATDEAASFTWTWAYAMINNTNVIITNVENPAVTGMTQGNKNRINAEARFFRAFAYNILATCFGDVPLITEPLSAPKTDFVRTSLQEINRLIEEDLLFGATNLPSIDDVKKKSGQPMYARANKAMAQQLLAEAYLRMGEPAKAEAQCQAIINSNEFSLITARYGVKANEPGDPFSDMFIPGNQRRSQGNREAIWVMEIENPTDVPGGATGNPQQRRNWGAQYHSLTGGGMVPADSLGGRGIARMRLNDWVLYGLYDEGDMRNSKYSIRREFWYNDPAKPELYGKRVIPVPSDTLFNICPYTTKWGHFDPRDVFGYGMWKDFILMRLGETYLLLAEAQVEQQKFAAAAESINALRTRANAPTVEAKDMNLDFILDERVRELIGEENRRMTLMRTKQLVNRATRLNSGGPINAISGLTNTHLLMPIPQSEIDLNKDAVLGQNDGY